MASHPRPLGRAGLRGDAPADTSGARRAPLRAVPRCVPDAGRVRAGRSSRGRAAVVRARVQPPRPVLAPRRGGVGRPSTPGPSRTTRPRCAASPASVPTRRGPSGRSPSATTWRPSTPMPCACCPAASPERRSAPPPRRASATASSRRVSPGSSTRPCSISAQRSAPGPAPRCDSCPLRRQCLWRRAGHPEPDPWRARPGARAQGTFAGSERQGRGRLLHALRQGAVAREGLAEACGWPDDAARADRTAAALVAEGFARWSRGRLRLG